MTIGSWGWVNLVFLVGLLIYGVRRVVKLRREKKTFEEDAIRGLEKASDENPNRHLGIGPL